MSNEHNYDDVKDGAASTPKAGDNILARLSGMAMDQKRAEAEVAQLEEKLKAAKLKLVGISEKDIPELMDENGMSEYTTKDGIKIKVTEKIIGSIPKPNEDKAFEWLKENGHDDLIKREFKIEFPKTEEKWADKFLKDLQKRKRPLAFTLKRAVHPSTLSSFVKGQLESGVDFPMDTFGVFRRRTSIIDLKE